MLAARQWLPGTIRLRERIRPYVRNGEGSAREPNRGRNLRKAWDGAAAVVGHALEGGSDAALDRKLRQARVLENVPASERVAVYRTRVLTTIVTAASVALISAIALRRGPAVSLGFVLLGAAAGATFWRGRLDRAIEERRAVMRIELFTVNQLLAMHIRVGSGVIASVRRLTVRGRGEVIGELGDILRLHLSGVPAAEAFRRASEVTPEPHARRTYGALAAADENGSDVARALLALSEDVRDGRRDAVRRRATRRRALMLVPILGLLAPVLILFVAAPLPWLVMNGFG
jgi:Flp pilus assembly protein TadB